MSKQKMGAEKRIDACSLISNISNLTQSFLRSEEEEKEIDTFSLILKISNLTENFLTPEKHRKQLLPELLPGIPDEITLDHISTKLPWSALCVLSLVSRSWKQAIQTRQVYNGRVRSDSTETLVLISSDYCGPEGTQILKLFSVQHGSFHPLPPFPSLRTFTDVSSSEKITHVALDGKIYLVGGLDSGNDDASAKVFVLDVAGQSQWKPCASMLEPRYDFGCGVFGGKIYVFGGYSSYSKLPAFGSEVYDPKTNAWSPITPMSTLRSRHEVAIVGEELLVYGGEVADREFFERNLDGVVNGVPRPPPQTHKVLEFYNPVTNNWRVSAPLRSAMDREWIQGTFTTNGKLFSMDFYSLSLSVYNFNTDSWTYLQASIPPFRSRTFFPVTIQEVNGELLARGTRGYEPGRATTYCFLKSIGFGEDRRIEWVEENLSHSVTNRETVEVVQL